MRLELSHIRQPETEFKKVFQPADVQGEDEEYRITAPVELQMVIHKDHDRFRLVGSVTTELELACSRCLEPYRMPIDRDFDLRYLPAGAAAHGNADEGEDEGDEVEDDDVAMTFYRDEQIDLTELLREQFYLALPMKPLCRDDCQGICPQCGTNRNTAPCDCNPQWEDPRMAGLKTLLTKRKHDDA
jgi:DUF177 domain-containing protein